MRIIVWNCGRGLHQKFEALLGLKPDLAILPECANPDILRQKAPGFAYADVDWRQGSAPYHGLGVFAFGDIRLRLHESWDPDYHLFMPIEVRGTESFNLLAVWAFNHRAPQPKAEPNPVTTLDAIEHYAAFLKSGRAIVAGDFNSSVIWDEVGRYSSFSRVDERLKALGLTSAYHAHFPEKLGEESRETHYHMYKQDRGFHIDYAYVPTELLPNLTSVSVGTYEEWRPRSDHAPLVVDIDMAVAALPSANRIAGATHS